MNGNKIYWYVVVLVILVVGTTYLFGDAAGNTIARFFTDWVLKPAVLSIPATAMVGLIFGDALKEVPLLAWGGVVFLSLHGLAVIVVKFLIF
jgi:hypothetical protein